MPDPNLPPGFDFTDPDIYAERLPVEELAQLRRIAPIWWNEQPVGKGGYNDGGFWVVTKHKDVKEVSLRSDIFSSWQNTALSRHRDGVAREIIDMQRLVMLNMDAPHHTRLRRIISRGFTPRAVGRLRDELDQRAQNVAKAAAAEGSGDFVEQVACELPLQAIAGLLGVPLEDRKKIFDWSNELVGDVDPEFAKSDSLTASTQLIGYAMQMAAEKAKNPGDDIVTQLVEADLDGEKLSDDEFGWFVLMLAVAGNETTRNSITQGMMAFTEHPDQWDLFKRERPEIAADEIVRWATPVTSFQRTAVEDTELSGVQIRKGQRVVMFYRSANFDEEVFEDPFTFNILRNPNPHVGFGGHGAHYCIGANLAKMTLNLMFGAVADHMPDLAPNSSPDRLRSGWLNGIKHWQVDYSGASRRKKMMSDNDQLIREFCALWSASKIEEIIDFFAEDAVYHNIPMDPAVGKEAIGTTIRGFFAALRGIDFVIHKQVAAGNLVMNERTDTFHGDGFSVPLPIMGVFEISEGKIKAWRDYFDLSTMMNAMAGATT